MIVLLKGCKTFLTQFFLSIKLQLSYGNEQLSELVIAEILNMEVRMTMKNTFLAALATTVTFANAVVAANPQEQAVHRAHDKYLAAINANDLDAFLTAVTNDIVFIAPNSPMMVGMSAVEPWVRGYFEAVETSWDKTTIEIVVADGWAFERYTYLAVDRPHGGGKPSVDTGNGINIYRVGADGVWRVARDIWATNRPLSGDAGVAELATCTDLSGPC